MKLKKKCKIIRLYNSNVYVRVDPEDYDRLIHYRWILFKSDKWQYAVRTECIDGKQKTIFMHREIMGIDDSKVYVDHKDHDGLNNQ